jgi:hypothetical protein
MAIQYMAQQAKRIRQAQVDFTEDENEVFEGARRAYRHRTGQDITWAEVARDKGAADFVRGEGLSWPVRVK